MFKAPIPAKLVAVLALLTVCLAGADAATTELKTGDPAPDFTLPNSGGEETSLSSFRDKVVLLNFWASWCSPCLVELPLLDRLHKRYSEAGLVVIGLNIDTQRAPATGAMKQLELSLPVLFDPESRVVRAYNPRALPTTYILDQTGSVKHIELGEIKEEDLPDFEARLAQLLGTAPIPANRDPAQNDPGATTTSPVTEDDAP